ncbi:glycosyltransferase [Amycolatopsis sp. NBC_01480]|uniref:glycosyltransferase n=1 Tax=Amycolatopsis sp. NBC_01480 TaxID=2903562 RepID=UPI002E2AB405|nr:nucleotide disphospho-sugar-binding domain-containing protein [Amycolatopsis sp. NBC_01480]
MRILFSSVPSAGHLLPLLPLADAAAGAGHETAFLSAPDMARHLGDRTLLLAGPEGSAILAETERRTGGGDARHPGEAAVEHFAGARVDLTYDEALTQARRFAPALMVCEALDFVGPMVASALDIPWAALTATAPLPAPLAEAMRERADTQHTARGVRPRERLALIDPLPDALRTTGEQKPPDSIAVRPVAHRGEHDEGARPRPASGTPLVLVTAGTTVREPELLAGLVASVTDAGYEVAVTVDPGTLPEDPRVHQVGFVPLARLLPTVEAVVGTAGLGTVLATLAGGLPTVLRPVLADQPWNAQLVAKSGAGIAIEDPAEAGWAVRTVLSDPAYRAAAQAASDSIRAMPSPAAVFEELLVRAGLSARM